MKGMRVLACLFVVGCGSAEVPTRDASFYDGNVPSDVAVADAMMTSDVADDVIDASVTPRCTQTLQEMFLLLSNAPDNLAFASNSESAAVKAGTSRFAFIQ